MNVLQKIKQIFTVFFAVMIFITSTGFNVYHHHCNTNKTNSYSVFFDNTTCDHSEKHHHLKHTHSTSCCGDYEVTECENNFEEKECCEILKTYHKVEIQNKVEKSVKHFEFSAVEFFILATLFDFSTTENFSDIIIDKESPPLLFGKDLIYFIKKIKIPLKLF